jgi:signal transduction histidine kinase
MTSTTRPQALLSALFSPLNLAAHITWLAIFLDVWLRQFPNLPPSAQVNVVMLFGVFVAALIAHFAALFPARWCSALVLLQGFSALALVVMSRNSNSVPVLLVIVAAQAAALWSTRAMLMWMLFASTCLYVIYSGGLWRPQILLAVFMHLGFQGFAVVMMRVARAAEDRAEALRAINAELLATRALLLDGARDQERLRLSRELHDVAGHKLTALKLNLRALTHSSGNGNAPELHVCAQLADELLNDLRGVVRQMRADGGIDLGRALKALASPFQEPTVRLHLDPDLQVESLALAQTIVRVVQEGITNAARHAQAGFVDVSLNQTDNGVQLRIEDDGRSRGPIHEGHGLRGMRERVEEHGGSLLLGRGERGLCVTVSLPT